MVEVEAVRLVGPPVPFSSRHHSLEARAPAGGDGVEAQARRGRYPSGGERRDQLRASVPRRPQVAVAGAEVEAPGVPGADREAAVRLSVDAALDPRAPAFVFSATMATSRGDLP